MRLRKETIGALNLFRTHEDQLGEADLNAAQSLADLASIAILHHRADLDPRALNDQLTRALNSRLVIEQAKGIIAENSRVEMVEAFSLLRTYARNNSRLRSDVVRDVIDGALRPESLSLAPGSGYRKSRDVSG